MSVVANEGDRRCLYDESVPRASFKDCEWDKPYLTRLRAIAVTLQHTDEEKVRKYIKEPVKLLGVSDTVVTRGAYCFHVPIFHKTCKRFNLFCFLGKFLVLDKIRQRHRRREITRSFHSNGEKLGDSWKNFLSQITRQRSEKIH